MNVRNVDTECDGERKGQLEWEHPLPYMHHIKYRCKMHLHVKISDDDDNNNIIPLVSFLYGASDICETKHIGINNI